MTVSRIIEAERSNRGFGALSPRDSVEVTIGPHLTIDYSRPAGGASSGRGIVPCDAVWQLGADMATQRHAEIRWADMNWSVSVRPD